MNQVVTNNTSADTCTLYLHMYNVIYFVYILKTYTVIASQFFFVILGDEIVCYVEKFFKDKCLVNFFTNGKLVYRHWGHMDKENVYATVGVKFGPAHLIVQWPKPGDFKIDIVCLKVFFFLHFRLKPVNWLNTGGHLRRPRVFSPHCSP